MEMVLSSKCENSARTFGDQLRVECPRRSRGTSRVIFDVPVSIVLRDEPLCRLAAPLGAFAFQVIVQLDVKFSSSLRDKL